MLCNTITVFTPVTDAQPYLKLSENCGAKNRLVLFWI